MSIPRLPTILLFAALACVNAHIARLHGAQKQDQAKNQADLRKKYVRPTDPALYVGPETCQACHDEIYKQFETTPHFITTMEGKLEAHKGPEWHGCEACHGPGKEHVDGGGDVTKIFTFKNASPQETSARCLGCHQYTEEHGNYERSAHLLNGIGDRKSVV